MNKNKQLNITIFLFVVGGTFILLSATMIFMQNRFQNQVVATEEPLHTEETYPEIPRVSLEDAKAALDSSSAIFVDVRSAETYAESHIKDSVNIPLAEIESRIGELEANQWIITYCT